MNRIASAVFGHGHHAVRDWVWRHGDRLKYFRAWRSGEAVTGRILHVTSSFDLGGTQTQIKHLATAQPTRFEHRVTEIFPELNYLYRQDERLHESRYVRGNSIGRAIGRSVMSRDRRGYELVQVAKLVRDLQADRPVAVVGWGHEICITAYLAAAIARVPHILFSIRTFNPTLGWADPKRAESLRAAHRWMAPRVSAVVTNSMVLRDDYAQWLGLDSGNVMVCANGVSLDVPRGDDMATYRTRVRRSLGIADGNTVVTNIGRFSMEKGQPVIIRANALLPSDVRQRVTWLLCGDGPTLEETRELARVEGASNVQFLGRTARVWEILAASDIFVMPSDYEGMPNAVMEAMAAALPCVSTKRSGIRDIAREGVDALYFDAGDAPALAAKIRWLTENPARAADIGHSAAARVREFSVARFVNCFENVIAKSLGSPVITAA